MSGYSCIKRIGDPKPEKIENRLTMITSCEKYDVMPLFIEFCQTHMGYSLVESESQYLQAIRQGNIDQVKDIAYRMHYLKTHANA